MDMWKPKETSKVFFFNGAGEGANKIFYKKKKIF